jgi:hypothetical protein
MADSDPRLSPNSEPVAEKDANVFSYDVSSQSKIPSPQKPNPSSPLAAG